MKIMSPTDLRKNLFKVIREVNHDKEEILVHGKDEENSVVIISKNDWDAIRETLYLENTGTMDLVREREKDDSGYTEISEIDWDNL